MNGKIKALFLTMLMIVSIFTILLQQTIADTDSKPPELTSAITSLQTIGFGHNTYVNTDIYDNESGIDIVKINITYPDSSYTNLTMNNTQGATYEHNFTDAWLVGQYNYTIWVKDNANNTNITTQNSFNISSEAAITISTIKDVYYDNETINLTDPPLPKSTSFPNSQIGYQYLDGGDILWLWNRYDNYSIDTTSGIQLTNHKDDYWSHNVLMLGYYNNDRWNLIYRTDQLTNFTTDIETDNESYVNITFWKNLEYAGYTFRLAIRYSLSIDDADLTVIPYIKNTGQNNIPYTLGFGWELKDIQINMTEEEDYIEIGGESYYLNNSLDNIYTNLNESQFYIKEDIGNNVHESLYLIWDEALDYKVTVKSRTGQYNAPVTLFIKIGTLATGQEKFTELLWHDASQTIYYFDDWSELEEWTTNPDNMIDGESESYASTTTDEVQLCTDNSYSSKGQGTISKVEISVSGYDEGNTKITLRPVFGGTTDGDEHDFYPGSEPMSSNWFDITDDEAGPGEWDWDDISALDMDVESDCPLIETTVYCSEIQLQVSYTINYAPTITNPTPSSGSDGISLTPWLNITVNDTNDDNMNITWLTNYSGEWVQFGSNTTVESGTYHQNYINATENGRWYYWRVNVTDGVNYTLSDVYSFYTGYESKLENTGSTNISGYLLIQIHYYHDSLDQWLVVNDTVRETTTRTISSGGYLALDTIFNGNINASSLCYWNGTYRVSAALVDPIGNILKDSNEDLVWQVYTFQHFRSYQVGWRRLMGNGFGNPYNSCTRGMAVYDGELYVGTQNLNYTKMFGLIRNLFIDLLDEEIYSAQQYNTFMNSFMENQSYNWSSNISNSDFIKINDTIQIIQQNSTNISSTDGLRDFSNVINNIFDGQNKSQYMSENNTYLIHEFVDNEYYDLLAPLSSWGFGDNIQRLLSQWCDGCEIWKYSYSTDEWIPLISDVDGSDMGAGFDDSTTMCAASMAVFNNKLYVGTWRAPDFGGCEVWRYDGSDWECVVGDDDSVWKGGFNDDKNAGAWSMEIFDGDLYIGTLNADGVGDGLAQIWRSSDGNSWTQVVDEGFKEYQDAGTYSRNVYVWRMEVYDNEIYAGTFNAKVMNPDAGCQLWKSDTGDDEDWEKVDLSGGFGFGEPENWGIRVLKEYDNELIVGTATSLLQIGEDIEALEIWSYDGTGWDAIVSDNIGNPEDWEKDGFGDHRNKYAFSEAVTYDGELWIGTFNGPLTIGCEVWCYDGNEFTPKVRYNSEISNGFGDLLNSGARSMIEYPINSNKIIVGTFRGSIQALLIGLVQIGPIIESTPWGEEVGGCEVWIRNGDPIN